MTSPVESAPSTRAHCLAGLVSFCVLIAAVAGVRVWAERLERAHFGSMLPLFADPKEHDESEHTSLTWIEHLKNQGTAIQRRAFERSDMLPLYGSSELVKRIPDKSSLFFRNFPSGFSVFPVGKAGATPLIILEKLAALHGVTAGKRVAISLSPSWFFTEAPAEGQYNGNFSRQQALGALLNPHVSFGFKRDLARRLQLHPASLGQDALLRFLTNRLARGGHLDHALYFATWPLAQMQQALYSAQDHFETGLFVKVHSGRLADTPPKIPAVLDWETLIAQASSLPNPAAETGAHAPPVFRRISNDDAFRENLESAPGWVDLELLLSGLHEMGMMTLVLCMPPNGVYMEKIGVSKESLDLFAGRIRAIALRYGAHVEAFEDHEEDVNFLVDHHDHMSAKGWMYYNRALDEFYHTDPALLEEQFAKGHRKRQHMPATLGRS